MPTKRKSPVSGAPIDSPAYIAIFSASPPRSIPLSPGEYAIIQTKGGNAFFCLTVPLLPTSEARVRRSSGC